MPDGYPWGNRTARQSNPYKDMPKTGVTRYYDFTIDQMTLAPDGYCISSTRWFLLVAHPMLVINGAFPGPTIEANWGDTIQVTVHNNLKEGTSLHWHGLLQQNTVCPPQWIYLMKVLHGWCSRSSTMPDCPWKDLHLPFPCRSLRDILVPFTL